MIQPSSSATPNPSMPTEKEITEIINRVFEVARNHLPEGSPLKGYVETGNILALFHADVIQNRRPGYFSYVNPYFWNHRAIKWMAKKLGKMVANLYDWRDPYAVDGYIILTYRRVFRRSSYVLEGLAKRTPIQSFPGVSYLDHVITSVSRYCFFLLQHANEFLDLVDEGEEVVIQALDESSHVLNEKVQSLGKKIGQTSSSSSTETEGSSRKSKFWQVAKTVLQKTASVAVRVSGAYAIARGALYSKEQVKKLYPTRVKKPLHRKIALETVAGVSKFALKSLICSVESICIAKALNQFEWSWITESLPGDITSLWTASQPVLSLIVTGSPFIYWFFHTRSLISELVACHMPFQKETLLSMAKEELKKFFSRTKEKPKGE